MFKMKKIFQCQGCGECCKQFGKENNSFLPLFEWETEDYKELAKQKGIALNIEPIHFFLDKKSGFVFCLEYGMFNQPCPFLENNKCSIYNNRALVCRQFPIFWTPQFTPDKSFGRNCFLTCKNFESKKQFDELFKTNKEISGEEIKEYLITLCSKCHLENVYPFEYDLEKGIIE